MYINIWKPLIMSFIEPGTTTMDNRLTGFRFYPTEEELVSFYLHNKLQGNTVYMDHVIPVVSIYDIEPWLLPRFSGVSSLEDTEQWFFFVPRQERETRGGRPSRTTSSGYWKATGSPGYVYSSDNKEIGLKKTMVFYNGRAPAGKKTKWKMHEYRAIQHDPDINVPNLRTEFTLCRVYVVSGSFRAFDRRPTDPTAVAAQRGSTETASPAELPQSTGSPEGETSYKPAATFPGLETIRLALMDEGMED